MPVVVETIEGVRSLILDFRADATAADRSTAVALVPTMGALHAGHLEHVVRARELADLVVVSIFVNPLQFGPNEDYLRYPRDLDADAASLEGADVIFAPDADEMYPNGAIETLVTAGRIGATFEGRSRPGHYGGVLTVVNKLLNVVQPSFVTFGQKDAQQIFLVNRMIADLNMPVDVVTIDTVREADGLAMSSRNRYLGAEERIAARALPRALEAAESSADRGVDAVIAAAQSALTGEPAVDIDYLAVVDPATFLPVDTDHHGTATVLVAARVGETRLIDNAAVRVG